MEHMRLHHVGIVISPEKAERFMQKFGLETADCLFTKRRSDESYIELVIPKGGVLAEYNQGKGGIHHIAFEVDDVEKVRQEYEAQGLHMLEKAAVPGAGGIIVNFLRPRFGEGILTEFVQKV